LVVVFFPRLSLFYSDYLFDKDRSIIIIMAAPSGIQAQIRKVEDILKGYLYEGPLVPLWAVVEQKTNLKRERVALGLLGFIAIYLVLGWAKDFVCNFIGFLYPAYAS